MNIPRFRQEINTLQHSTKRKKNVRNRTFNNRHFSVFVNKCNVYLKNASIWFSGQKNIRKSRISYKKNVFLAVIKRSFNDHNVVRLESSFTDILKSASIMVANLFGKTHVHIPASSTRCREHVHKPNIILRNQGFLANPETGSSRKSPRNNAHIHW